MFPGGMEVGQEELAALARVIESKNLFRYYGVGDGPDEVVSFEREFAEHMRAAGYRVVNLEGPGPVEDDAAPSAHALALPPDHPGD